MPIRLDVNEFHINATCVPDRLKARVVGDPSTVNGRVVVRLRGHGVDQAIANGVMQLSAGGVTTSASAGDGEFVVSVLNGNLAIVASAVPSAQRRFWCVYAVVTKPTGPPLEVSAAVCRNCADAEVDPELHADVITTPSSAPAATSNLCSCYCLAAWIGPVPTPDVPDPGQPTVSGVFTQTETTLGSEKWNATVTRKDYNCPAHTTPTPTTLTAVLTHNRYRVTRSRSLGFGWWWILPALRWGVWSPLVRTPDPALSDPEALASGTPPLVPWCPNVGFPCP